MQHAEAHPRRIVSACFLINLQIGIGVLALPTTLHALGFIPGLILIVFSGYLTTMMDLVISMFKKAHPEVYSVAEVGYILGGWAGREVLGAMYWVSRFKPYKWQSRT